ncbi:hypothetical protein [Butyrivibrio sp. MC2013]|uniref:hypothetical protein n=1 Tax=Butyrivibrio sp. MC2013 TaxID=1280686 RepID=UPI000425FA87|nr:hypothetical protein [Butyrivibrio sp. MC2013]
MKTFLDFPDEFYVGKKIEPEKFWGPRAVSQEQKELIKCISDLEIVYDLKFKDDSEIIVFSARVAKYMNKWTDSGVARLLASKISYRSMVIVHDGYVANIYSFYSRSQKKNGGMNIMGMVGLKGIEMRRPDEEHTEILEEIRKAIIDNDSAPGVCLEWNCIIEKYWNNHKRTKYFGYSVDGWLNHVQSDRDRQYEYELQETFENFWINNDYKEENEFTDRCEDKYWWWNKDE